jgi:hypothetical protein
MYDRGHLKIITETSYVDGAAWLFFHTKDQEPAFGIGHGCHDDGHVSGWYEDGFISQLLPFWLANLLLRTGGLKGNYQ